MSGDKGLPTDSTLSWGLTRRPFWRSLAGRIVGLSLSLLLVIQVLGFITLRRGIEANARLQLQEQLQLGERVLLRLLDQNGQMLTQAASLLASDYAFRDAVQSQDVETVRSALDNHGARIGASVTALLDVSGQVQAFHGDAQAPESAVLPALRDLSQRTQPSRAPQPQRGLALVGPRAYQFVMVPMKAPLLIGWVVMGFPLESGLAQQLHSLSGLDVAFVSEPPGAPPQVVLGNRPEAEQAGLAAWIGLAPGLSEHSLGAERVALRHMPLAGTRGGALHVMLYRSIDQAVAPFQRLQTTLAGITVAGLLIFALGSWVTAQRVTQPVRALLRASRRLGEGDFETPVPVSGSHDELADLAQAFDGMRLGLAQRSEQVRQLAFWDRLTGLPNRAQFEQALGTALHRQAVVSVLVLNLDRLEQVNQVLGRARGDQLLQTTAERLRAVARRRDEQPGSAPGLLARLGGDEFALLLPGDDLERTQALARDVLRTFEHPVSLDGHPVDLSAGMGVASYPAHASEVDTLLSRALLAMTEAKRRKTEYVVYAPSIDAGSAQTLSLLGELRHALRHGELRLFLQPKLRLTTSSQVEPSLAGAEALVRWQHPVRGLVPPAQFIPFAEETGFIHELTLWVVDEAARLLATQQAQGLRLRLSVNLSAHDLMKPDLVEQLDQRLSAQGVSGACLCLEITESAIAADPQRALQTLHALKARGYKLSIDDFGAGYTSLGQLIELPVDELKIDMLFVRTMDSNPDKAAMVRFIVGLAHDCRLSVVAEGVENAAILAQLQALGCDEAQGYHISKPMPAAELNAWAAQRWPAAVPSA